jgi:ribosomal protein S18 acetylase RimI-like enzyme
MCPLKYICNNSLWGGGNVVEVIKYNNQFLPHVIRLYYPEAMKIDSRLDYFRQTFALFQPGPEQSCLLAKGSEQLLACAYLASFEKIQPGLIFVSLAVDSYMTEQDFTLFWEQCFALARTLVSGPMMLRVGASHQRVSALLAGKGLKVAREQLELHAALGQLPPDQNPGEEDFSVKSLAQQPDLEAQWLDTFNQGINAFWDIPPLDRASLGRMRQASAFDPAAFRVGYSGQEAVAAQYYSVIDRDAGIVRLNLASTPSSKRSRGYGRRMLKDALNYLEQQGFSTAVIYADAASQATGLLYKMLGFQPAGTVKILESAWL